MSFFMTLATAAMAYFSVASFAQDANQSGGAYNWDQLAEASIEPCASFLESSLSEAITWGLQLPQASEFYLHTSLSGEMSILRHQITGYPLDTHDDVANRSLRAAGLRLSIGAGPEQGKLFLYKFGEPIYVWAELFEPMTEFRFVSDKSLRISEAAANGYLSAIGWTRTTYFRIEGRQVRKVTLKEMDQVYDTEGQNRPQMTPPAVDIRPDFLYAHIEKDKRGYLFLGLKPPGGFAEENYLSPASIMSIFKAAGLSVDKSRFLADGRYFSGLIKKFNSSSFRVAAALPILATEDRQTDYFLLSRFPPPTNPKSILFTALGELAEAIYSTANRACSKPVKNLHRTGYPTVLLRLAVRSLWYHEILDQFVEIFNSHINQHGKDIKITSTLPPGITSQTLLLESAKCGPLYIELARNPFSERVFSYSRKF